MTVRSKLNATLLIVIGSLLAVIGGLIFSSQRARTLMDLGVITNRALAATYRLTDHTKELIVTIAPLTPHLENWERAAADFDAVLANLQQSRAITLISEDLRQQISRVQTLWDRMQTDRLDASRSLQSIVDDPTIAEFRLLGLDSMLEWTQNAQLDELETRLETLIATLRRFDIAGKDLIASNLSMVADGVGRQTVVIAARGFAVVSFAAVVVVAAGLVFSLMFTRRLTGRLGSMHEVMGRLAERDLTARTSDQRNDEIADLANYTNSVLDRMSGFIDSVKDAVTQARDLKDRLASGSMESASALNEISKNIESIKTQFDSLHDSVSQSTRAIEAIDDKVGGLNASISNQAAAVSESASSLEEIHASIRSVTRLSSERRDAAEKLTHVVLDGSDRIQDANDSIRSISGEIDDVLGIIEIINGIAQQTNILSMNAGIESAHAGEAGRGFAVVAEEIRKLAESTTENASRIDALLRSITDEIRAALEFTESAADMFEGIGNDVGKFSESMGEIVASMDEISGGSDSVVSMTSQLSSITNDIKVAADEIVRSSGTVRQAMASADSLSSEMTNGMTEIDHGAKEVLKALGSMSQISAKNRERMEQLGILVAEFKTRAEEADIEDVSSGLAQADINRLADD